LTQPDGTKLVISRPTADAAFTVEDAPADAKFKSETRRQPAMALETLDLDDVHRRPICRSPAELYTASFVTFDGLTVDVRLFDRDNRVGSKCPPPMPGGRSRG
jgi:hypothetical protein